VIGDSIVAHAEFAAEAEQPDHSEESGFRATKLASESPSESIVHRQLTTTKRLLSKS
jgi:hypothetical protein